MLMAMWSLGPRRRSIIAWRRRAVAAAPNAELERLVACLVRELDTTRATIDLLRRDLTRPRAAESGHVAGGRGDNT